MWFLGYPHDCDLPWDKQDRIAQTFIQDELKLPKTGSYRRYQLEIVKWSMGWE